MSRLISGRYLFPLPGQSVNSREEYTRWLLKENFLKRQLLKELETGKALLI